MAVLTTTQVYVSGDQVTHTNLNNIIANASFGTDAYDDNTIGVDGSGSMYVKDGNLTAAKLASNSVTTAKITDANVTPAKLSAGAPTWDTTTTTIYASLDFAAISTSATAGTYGRSGNTVTITMAGHGMSTGMVAALTFTGGTGGAATNGSYPITYISSSQFSIIDPTSGTITGSPACSRTAYYGNSTIRGSETIGGNLTISGSLTVAGDDIRPLKLATAQNSTSGTSIDFTGIPSWVKRVTVLFNGVSLSGSSVLLIQLGSGSILTSGYISTSIRVNNATSTAGGSSTSGFIIHSGNSSEIVSGSMEICEISSNSWISSHSAKGSTILGVFGGGNVSLSGELDTIRITSLNGTDTFDAGQINIMYQ